MIYLLKFKIAKTYGLKLKPKKNIILGVIYRHPGNDISVFQDQLYDTLSNTEKNQFNYILSSDININSLAKNNKKISTLMNNLASVGCEMKINVHTRFAGNCKPPC